jgi:hypothetical protein
MPGLKVNYRFGFNGQERSDEVYGKGNLNTALFWEYDTRLGRRWNIDPVDKPWISSYHAFNNKPITYVDPKGDNANPIIDIETGELLGTDNKGLQGEAIIMNKMDFEQGMDHEKALEKGTLASKVDISKFKPDVILNAIKTINSLPSRPDWDGKLTKKEADDWWLNGGGKPLFVDASKIDLDGIYANETFSCIDGKVVSPNFIFRSPILNTTGQVYGTLDLKLLSSETGEIQIGYITPGVSPNGLVLDRYDFKPNGQFFRDKNAKIGKPSGNGTDYDIHSYGVTFIPLGRNYQDLKKFRNR